MNDKTLTDIFWVLVASGLVFVMQAGFALMFCATAATIVSGASAERYNVVMDSLEAAFKRIFNRDWLEGVNFVNLFRGSCSDEQIQSITDYLELMLRENLEQSRQQMERLFSVLHVEPASLAAFMVESYAELESINGILRDDDPDSSLLSRA